MKIVGLSGSLRSGSYNTALLKAAKAELADIMELQVCTVHDIPLYDGDVETREGIPKKVKELKDQLIHSDGLLLFTPEYNHSVPGVLKNAIDWITRPPQDIKEVFGDLPVALLGASPNGFGTILAQEAWLPVFRTLGMKPWFGQSMMVAKADKVFDNAGKIIDPNVTLKLRQFLEGFAAFVESGPQFSKRIRQSMKQVHAEPIH